jgi:hypothetical protein
MLLIGASPPERNIEQHDVFFGIGDSINDLIPDVLAFWPGNNKLHFDAWREITSVNGYEVKVVLKNETSKTAHSNYSLLILAAINKMSLKNFTIKW